MSKFPLLNTYRSLAIILAVIILIGGVVVALGAAMQYGQSFNVGTFISVALPFLAGAFGFGIVAEFIQLALRVEDHLDHIRQATERQVSQFSPNDKQASRTTSPQASSSQRSTHGSSPQRRDVDTQATARIQAKVSTPIHTKPETGSASSGELNSGQTMTVYGRNNESMWLSMSRTGKLWINAADVEVIQGSVNLLSIMQPPE